MKATMTPDVLKLKKEDIFTLCGKPQIETDHDKKVFKIKFLINWSHGVQGSCKDEICLLEYHLGCRKQMWT